MAPAARSDGKLNLNLSDLSQTMEHSNSAGNSPFNGPKLLGGGLSSVGTSRVGTSSPLLESGTRLYPKRTRELQAQTLSPSIWGPPTSGTSSPLHLIPESPSQDSFPDLLPISETSVDSSKKRLRAGTLPSRISPIGSLNGFGTAVSTSKTSRPTPSSSPFRPLIAATEHNTKTDAVSSDHASLLSRLRAGSMPQRSGFLASSNSPFGSSFFAPGWAPRDRAATLTNLRSSEDPTSPGQSTFLKEGMTDTGVRTLDYLGLAETPQPVKVTPFLGSGSLDSAHGDPDRFPDLISADSRNGSRFRSFSVNAPRSLGEEKEEFPVGQLAYSGGSITPSAAAAIEAEYEAVQEKVRLHNLAVQDFARNASAARPRARTAGIIEAPQRQAFRGLVKAPSPVSNDISLPGSDPTTSLAESLQSLSLNPGFASSSFDVMGDDEAQASRSLWIGNIPVSITTSSLDPVFSRFGRLESTRVLTHKNCGFVNFENIEDAVRARQVLNGKELFPGSGAVRIGFAKVPSATSTMVTAHDKQSSSPNSQGYGATNMKPDGLHPQMNGDMEAKAASSDIRNRLDQTARLSELQPELLSIVLEFGAQQSDLVFTSASIQRAINYRLLEKEIPPIPEPSPSRMYDAPRLRDIRKRIDNGAYNLQEIEQIAVDILPEIVELSSDYLGNTVVQKLFEFCSEPIKEQMLNRICPHLAQIGVHKNGTWAAQKIIDVCKTQSQTEMIVENLHPYTVPLFLDQYGNYVLQCCLRFGSPYNDFIFETMLSQMWEIAQGRFGARAMRACLESHHASKHQQRLLAAVIALNAVQLAKNANGALLLTWLLDTCTFPARRSVLAPRLQSSLVELCTHKVSYLTVLKVINQRTEPEARDTILDTLFLSPGDHVLEQILSDQTSGATLIFKILTTPFFDEQKRSDVVRNISRVLTRIKAQPNQGYKRLMDEVGLSSRPQFTQLHTVQPHVPSYVNNQSRPLSQPAASNFVQPPFPQRQFSGNSVTNSAFPPFQGTQAPARTGSADAYGYSPYPLNGYNNQQTFPSLLPMTPQQVPYQNVMNLGARQNGNFMPSTAVNAFSGYVTPPASGDTVRSIPVHASPLPPAVSMSPMMGSGSFAVDAYSQPFQSTLFGFQQQSFLPTQLQTTGKLRRVGFGQIFDPNV